MLYSRPREYRVSIIGLCTCNPSKGHCSPEGTVGKAIRQTPSKGNCRSSLIKIKNVIIRKSCTAGFESSYTSIILDGILTIYQAVKVECKRNVIIALASKAIAIPSAAKVELLKSIQG